MDRQELRLVFERGDITLHGWIPTRLCLDAIVSSSDEERLAELFPTAEFDRVETYTGQQRQCRGRHRDIEVDYRIRLAVGQQQDKMTRYGDLVRALMEDQIKRIADESHERRITEQNSRESLRMAVRANTLSKREPIVTPNQLATP